MADVAPSMPQNEAPRKTPHNRSTFPYSYRFLDTHRFGEVHPFMVMETVPRDHIEYHPSQDVRSYTMQAPLMEDLAQRRLLTFTPMEAILPFNWDKWYTNPVQGNDVDENVGCVDPFFWERVALFIGNFYTRMTNSTNGYLNSVAPSAETVMTAISRWIFIGEAWFSNGSLLSSLGIHGAARWRAFDQGNIFCSFDSMVDALVPKIIANVTDFIYVRGSKSVHVDTSIVEDQLVDVRDSVDHRISFRSFLSLYRDDPSGLIQTVAFKGGKSLATLKSDLLGIFNDYQNYTIVLHDPSYTPGTYDSDYKTPLNFSRLVAYQLTCAEYFTNDHVDYIYDAKLFREHALEILNRCSLVTGNTFNVYFTVNGLRYYYDAFSGYAVSKIMDFLINNMASGTAIAQTAVNSYSYAWGYLSNLFSFRPSLRFKDYFTGSRTQPLAVDTQGDLNIASASTVSVLDITKGIQKQRFLNAINRSGRRLKEYRKELFGSNEKQDLDHPFYLAEVGNVIYGDEVNNTGSDQLALNNSVTQTLRTANNNYQFQLDFEREGILLAVNYYDIPRSYTRTTERQAFICNRFDHFNPYLQFIGDQAIYTDEIGSSRYLSLGPWSYTNRHMEWKQKYNQASGGFVESLPGWSFIADRSSRTGSENLDPDYIRSIASEFDIFFSHLTGYSLGTYFHFIVRSNNGISATREMAYAPSIL